MLGQALEQLTDGPPVGLLVLLLFALVLTAMVTQAFEFGAIRALEGYWGNSWIMRIPAHLGIAWQRFWRDHLLKQRDLLLSRAFQHSRLLERNLIPERKRYIVEIIQAELNGNVSALTTGYVGRRREREAQDFDWRQFAPAALMRRLQQVETRIDEFPADHRLLPTRLGNTIRAVEQSLPLGDQEDLEGAVIRRWADTPPAVQQEHDAYRTRLDLYCTLVFVFAVLAILGPILLPRVNGYSEAAIAYFVGFLVLGVVSYGAALASARRYTVVLKTIVNAPR